MYIDKRIRVNNPLNLVFKVLNCLSIFVQTAKMTIFRGGGNLQCDVSTIGFDEVRREI